MSSPIHKLSQNLDSPVASEDQFFADDIAGGILGSPLPNAMNITTNEQHINAFSIVTPFHNVQHASTSSAAFPDHLPQSPQQQVSSQPQQPFDMHQYLFTMFTNLQASINSLADQMHRRFEDVENSLDDLDDKIIEIDEKLERIQEASNISPNHTPSVLLQAQQNSGNSTPASTAVQASPPSNSSPNNGINNNNNNNMDAVMKGAKYFCEEHKQHFASSSNYYRHLREVHGKERRKKTKRLKRKRLDTVPPSQQAANMVPMPVPPQHQLPLPYVSVHSAASNNAQAVAMANNNANSKMLPSVPVMNNQQVNQPYAFQSFVFQQNKAQQSQQQQASNTQQKQQQGYANSTFANNIFIKGFTQKASSAISAPPKMELLNVFKNLIPSPQLQPTQIVLKAAGASVSSPIVLSDEEREPMSASSSATSPTSSGSSNAAVILLDNKNSPPKKSAAIIDIAKKPAVSLQCKHVMVNVWKKQKDTPQGGLLPMSIQALPSDMHENSNTAANTNDPWVVMYQENKSDVDTVMLQVQNCFSSSLYITVLLYDGNTGQVACIYPRKLAVIDSVDEFKKLKSGGKIELAFPSLGPSTSVLHFIVVATSDVYSVPKMFEKMVQESVQDGVIDNNEQPMHSDTCLILRRVIILSAEDQSSPIVQEQADGNTGGTSSEMAGLEETLQQLTMK